jgi:hypothetical protein
MFHPPVIPHLGQGQITLGNIFVTAFHWTSVCVGDNVIAGIVIRVNAGIINLFHEINVHTKVMCLVSRTSMH